MIVNGTSISVHAAQELIDLLLRDRSADALAAAAEVENAIEENLEAVDLSPACQAALVSVLEKAWRTDPTCN